MPEVIKNNEIIYKYIDFDVPNGCYFAPLRKGYNKVTLAHPLDNDIEGLYKVLNEQVIPICSSLSIAPECYRQRISQMIKHTFPAYDLCFSFPGELLYRLTVPKEQQTKENLQLLKILRLIFDFFMSATTILDDLVDGSDMRMNKPTWYKICKGGEKASIYDAIVFEKLIYYLLKTYFENSPVYSKMLEAVNKCSTITCIGQVIDIAEKSSILAGQCEVLQVNPYKSGHIFKLQATLVLLQAGITDEQIIDKVGRILYELFICMQPWNDFIDAFCTPDRVGRNTREDIANGCASWITQVALAHFNDEQKKKFFSCYGSSNEQDIQTIIDLYGQVNIPKLYLEFMKEVNKKCDSIIQEIPHEDLQRACINCKEWFLGVI